MNRNFGSVIHFIELFLNLLLLLVPDGVADVKILLIDLGEGVGASSGTFEIIEGSSGVRVGLVEVHVVEEPVGVDSSGAILANICEPVPAGNRFVVVLFVLPVNVPGDDVHPVVNVLDGTAHIEDFINGRSASTCAVAA